MNNFFRYILFIIDLTHCYYPSYSIRIDSNQSALGGGGSCTDIWGVAIGFIGDAASFFITEHRKIFGFSWKKIDNFKDRRVVSQPPFGAALYSINDGASMTKKIELSIIFIVFPFVILGSLFPKAVDNFLK